MRVRDIPMRGVLLFILGVVSLQPPDMAAAEGPVPAGAAPNFVPELILSYEDPGSGETISCEDGCRRFEVPEGVELEVRVLVRNLGGDVGPEGVAWDLWFDQRHHPFPGIDLEVCRDDPEKGVDPECWQAFNDRVNWEQWNSAVADVVCVPVPGADCSDVALRVPMDPEFGGSRGRGVYSLAAWVDRFQTFSDADEFDNYAGPIRVKVVPPTVHQTSYDSGSRDSPPPGLIEGNSAPRPYTVVIYPRHADAGFVLTSQATRRVLEFNPFYPGTVDVEVLQDGSYENMVVAVRKVISGDVLFKARGKGRLRFRGEIGPLDLKDDRRLEVVVSPAQGTRGVRGKVTVTYPARAVYRRTE
jgi:hypothetical protein